MTEYLSLEPEREWTDEELLEGSLVHPHLFAKLVDRYEGPFLRRAQSIIRSEDEAEDIVQETFTKVYLNAKKFKKQEGAAFSSWAWRILINTALTYYARKRRRGEQVAPLDQEVYEQLPDLQLRQFEKKELADLLASVLNRIPPAFARALTAHFIDGKSQGEIAKEEGVSVGAIKTRVHRAKKEFGEVYETLNGKG